MHFLAMTTVQINHLKDRIICLELFPGTDTLLLRGHVFHTFCLETWNNSGSIIDVTGECEETFTVPGEAKTFLSVMLGFKRRVLIQVAPSTSSEVDCEGKSAAHATICIRKRKKNAYQSGRHRKKGEQKLAETIT